MTRNERIKRIKELVAEGWNETVGDSLSGPLSFIGYLDTIMIDGVRLSIEEISQIVNYASGGTYGPASVAYLVWLTRTTRNG